MTTTALDTRSVLAEMLTENTGAHILDSGGAYGRNWERNNGKTLADFENEPTAWADDYGVVLSVFHFLANRVEFLPSIQAELDDLARCMPDEGWLAIAETLAERYDPKPRTWNTYNGEDSLSQTLQGVSFTRNDGETVSLIQIHGGCDVRGGYTKPRAFRVTVDMADCFPYDHNSYELECLTDNEHSLSYLGEYIGWHGSSIDADEYPTYDSEKRTANCVKCGSPFIVHASEPY
jgi:hypothetical protein